MHSLRRLAVQIVALVLLLTACGGGSGSSAETDTNTDDPGSSETTTAGNSDSGSESGAGGAINGALVSVTAVDLGFHGIDRDSGDTTVIVAEGVEFTDRDQQALVSDGVAHTIGYTTIEGQSYSSNAVLLRTDLTSGTAAPIVELGQNRANDEDTNLVEWHLVGSGDTVVWLTEGDFDKTEETFIAFDPSTGAELGRFEVGEQDRLFDPIVVGETLFARQNNTIVELDLSGLATQRLVFEAEGPTAITTLFTDTPSQQVFFVVEGGGVPTAEAIEAATYFQESQPSHDWTADDESIWWVFSDVTTLTTGETAVIAGVMQYNTSTDVVAAWPLGELAVEYLEENSISTMSQPDLMVRNGALWMVDIRDDGGIHRLDSATGAIESFFVASDDTVDYTRLEAVTTDPEAVWVETIRYVITAEDDSGRTSVGETTFERIDESTGSVVVAVSAVDLNGF